MSFPASQFDFMHSTALEGHETSPGGFKYAGFKTTAQVGRKERKGRDASG
jgi:hypothetical protein